MKPIWYESKGLIPWLLLIIIVLIIAIIIKEGLVTTEILETNKDTFDVVSTIITILAIIIGGILSYIKFFKGRILKPKLNIIPTSGVIYQTDENFHWLDLELQNKGTVAIWNYYIEVFAKLHGEKTTSIQINGFVEHPNLKNINEHLIDVGESSYEHLVFPVSKDIFAITYQILVSIPSGSVWNRCLTVSNKKEVSNL